MSDGVEQYVRTLDSRLADALRVASVPSDEPSPLSSRTLDAAGSHETAESFLSEHEDRCIVGDAGIGKSVLLQSYAGRLIRELPTLRRVPFYIQGRRLTELLSREPRSLRRFLWETAGRQLDQVEIDKLLHESNATLFLDGLDEAAPGRSEELRNLLQTWRLEWPEIRWIYATRPSAANLLPSEVAVANLMHFDDEAIRSYLVQRFPQEIAGRAWIAISSHADLRAFASNPILLNMIGHIFDQQGHLPTTWADICATSVDILLRQWDKQRGVEFASSQREVRVLLSDLALWMTTNEQNSCRLQDWSKSVIASGSYEDLRPFLELAERSGVVTHSSTDSVQFVHASIQEYLAAIALTDRPIHQAAGIASEFHLVETLAAVTPNADELVTEFVNDGKFTEAISVATKSQNGETKHRLLQEIAERMGLAGTIPPMITGSSFGDGVPWNRLKELWKKCDTAESKHEKGLALEDFSETFFGLVFQVVEKRLATDAGEVDLLCEHKQLDAFWIRWQSDVFVECKNQIDRSPVSDVNTFLGKCATCRSKLSFFVSRSGFTSVATTALGRSWGNRDLPDTVWIGGNDIERLLDEQSDPEDFLKIMCRRSNYGRG